MKMRFDYAVAAMMLALAASSCSIREMMMEPQENTEGREVMVRFTTDLGEKPSDSDLLTKTAFGEYDENAAEYPVFWTENDTRVAMSLNMGPIVNATVRKDAKVSSKADFSAVFSASGAPYVFYAMSPLSAATDMSSSRKAWAMNIPVAQKPSRDGLSCDESAMVLYAASGKLQSIPKDAISMQFHHATTYLRLVLGNIRTGLSDKKAASTRVKGVELTYSVPVAGEWYVDLENGALSEKAVSRTVTLDTTLALADTPLDLWVAMAPVKLDGQSVKVSVLTDKGQLSRTFVYGTRSYAAGAVNKLTLDMSKNSVMEISPSDSEVLQREQYGMYLTSGETLYTPFVSQLGREYKEGFVDFVILVPANAVELVFAGIPSGAGKGDKFELSVCKVTNGDSADVGVFNVTVVKEDGAKLWLADSLGNGFIIKR